MTVHSSERSVLTIATSKPVYVQMAVNLARSFKHWHQGSSIKFVLATDQPHLVPRDLRDIEIIQLKPGQYGHGFSPKLHLDQLACTNQTLFIDSDCLCFGPLEPVFKRFNGRDVSVLGDTVFQGECWGDVRKICQRYEIEKLPRFVGGLYYLEKSSVTTEVFNTARALESKYDEIGLSLLRGNPNEEPLIAIAMSIHGQTPIPDDGRIKAESMSFLHEVNADVFKGIALLSNKYGQPFPTWVQLPEARPVIIHFNCFYAEQHPYPREVVKLEKVMAKGWPLWAASAYANITTAAPQLTTRILKDTFRPTYRRIFGTRAVAKSKRI